MATAYNWYVQRKFGDKWGSYELDWQGEARFKLTPEEIRSVQEGTPLVKGDIRFTADPVEVPDSFLKVSKEPT